MSAMGPGCVKTPPSDLFGETGGYRPTIWASVAYAGPPTREFCGQLKVRPEFSHGLGRERKLASERKAHIPGPA